MYCAMIDKIATQELTFEITASLQTVWKRWFVLFVMNVCLSCFLFRCDLVCMKTKHIDLKCILPNILLPLKTWTRHNKLVANLLAEACGNCTNTMSHFTIILHCMDLHVNIVNIVFFFLFFAVCCCLRTGSFNLISSPYDVCAVCHCGVALSFLPWKSCSALESLSKIRRICWLDPWHWSTPIWRWEKLPLEPTFPHTHTRLCTDYWTYFVCKITNMFKPMNMLFSVNV